MENNVLAEIANELEGGDFEKAEELLKQIDLGGLSRELRLKYLYLEARVHFWFDRNELVMPLLKEIIDQGEDFPEIDRVYLLAGIWNIDEAQKKTDAERAKQLEDAEQYFKGIKVKKLSRNDQRIYYLHRGLLESHLGRIDLSIANFKNSLTLTDGASDQRILHSHLAEAYRDIQEYEQAIKHYDLEIATTPPTEERNIAFISISKARVMNMAGLVEDAKRVILGVLEKFDLGREKEDPEIAMYAHDVLRHSLYSLEDYPSALREANAALAIAQKIGEDTTDYLYQVSNIYSELKDYDNAEKKAKEALEITNDDDYIQLVYQQLYWIYRDTDQFDKAIEVLQALINRYPEYEDLGWAYTRLGHMHSLKGDYETAIVHFKKSLEILELGDDFYIEALDSLAYNHYYSGEVDTAMDICLGLLRDNPEGSDLNWAHVVLAKCYFKKGMMAEAIEQAQAAQRRSSKSSKTYQFAEEVLEDAYKELGMQ